MVEFRHPHMPNMAPMLSLSKESRQIRASLCRWHGCGYDFVNKPTRQIADHMLDHIHYSSGGTCGWSDCGWKASNVMDLEGHLLEVHEALSKSTIESEANFCHQCRSWSTSIFAWERHCEQHLKELRDPFCGSIIFKGAVIFAPLCPFCLGEEVKASKKYRQLPQTSFKDHIWAHIRDYRRAFSCPHPLCKKDSEYDRQSYLRHLGDVHGIFLQCKKTNTAGDVGESG